MVTSGLVELMGLALESWSGSQQLCNLGLFEVQFSYLKVKKYKYMSPNISHVKKDNLYKTCNSRGWETQ